MIIGFLGKGGSGKSTLATMLTRELLNAGKTVLAIDADHNMDLSYNLAERSLPPPYLGDAFMPIREMFGLSKDAPISSVSKNEITFQLSPIDNFTKNFTHTLSDKLSLMLTGPQTEDVLNGKRCSHSLATALKLYLPHVKLRDDEYVIVDEKASADAASTGIPTGFDLAVIVTEPRPQSVRVAKHIAQTLDMFRVPYVFVQNKKEDTSETELPYSARVGLHEIAPLAEALTRIAREQSVPNVSRLTRSYWKFEQQQRSE